MDTDFDGVGTLAMPHALADRGEVDILAKVVSSRYAWSAPCVEAINGYYGRPDRPIGVPKGAGANTRRGSRYARQIAEAQPSRLQTYDDAPKCRRCLPRSPRPPARWQCGRGHRRLFHELARPAG